MGKKIATEPLLNIPNLIPGAFIKRDNRFLITASIKEKNEKCHLHDPGRLKELLKPGAPLLLNYVTGNRKTKYDVIAIKKNETWILIHSGYHSYITQELLQRRNIRELSAYTIARQEYKYRKSRIDFLLKNTHKCLLEVKGCTLIQDRNAIFPDAPTQRGKRHLQELIHANQDGYKTAVLFLVMGNADTLSPNWNTDPEFAFTLKEARQKGVKLLACTFKFEKEKLFLGKEIPVNTNDLISHVHYLQMTSVGKQIKKKMEAFQKLGKGTNEDWFSELCFCILTANASGSMGIKIQDKLAQNFIESHEQELQKKLKKVGYRFHNRASYITCNRKYCNIKDIICCFNDSKEAREWLITKIKGIGYKEASHFLRNVGYEGVAILDRHILRCMKKHGIIHTIPSTLNKKKYIEIEEKLCRYAKIIGIDVGELDLYLWYMETGKVLK